MKRTVLLRGFLCAAAITLCAGEGFAADCKALLDQYIVQTKRLASEKADGVGDNSAPRETMRQLKILNLNMMRQMNLDMMIAGKCLLPDKPASDFNYSINALQCATKIVQGNYNAPECDYSAWSDN